MEHATATPSAALRLAGNASVELGSSGGLHVLHSSAGRIPLNDVAAAILLMCDGRHTRNDVLKRFWTNRGDALGNRQINAFLDAARSRAWITEGRGHAHS